MNDTDCMNHQTIFRSNLISSSWCQLLCMSSRWGFSSQFTHLSEELTWLLTRQRRQKIHYVENKEIIACGWMSPFRVTFSITFLVSFLLMLPKLDQLFLQYASMISWLLLIQGVQDQKCQKESSISWLGSIFDPTLVKPKCVWRICIFVGKISCFSTRNITMAKMMEIFVQASVV